MIYYHDNNLTSHTPITITTYIKRSALLGEISAVISDAYAKGKINEMHYNLLSEKIAKTKDNN